MKVAAFLPAKGTSERIPNKNLQLLNGKPLFLYTLEKLLECTEIDEVWIDSDSQTILNMASHLPCKALLRDSSLASNQTDGHKLFLNEVEHCDADIVAQVLCTSPFIAASTIDKAIRTLKDSKEFDSVVLVHSEKQYKWENEAPMYGTGRIPNSVELPPEIIESMGLYVIRREAALSTGRRFGDRPHLMEASAIEVIDVNTPNELELATLVATGLQERENAFLRNLVSHLSSPMLSDILDDLGVKAVVTGLEPNLPDARVLGRAKTLRLRKAGQGDDWKTIYNALQSYSFVVSNDIILVENEIPEFAYFGELNALLSRRAGASAAIVDGFTRDSAATMALGFPVFARGVVCHDVRKRAALDSINEPIKIGGVSVVPGDLVFADREGVVILPRRLERTVLDKAIEVLRNELNIKMDVALNVKVEDILAARGTF